MIETRFEALTRKLAEVRADLADLRAEKGRHATAMVALHKLEVEVDGEIRALVDREAEASLVIADESPLMSLLRETRRLRRAAETKGSMVAATRLLEREQSLLRDIAAEQLAIADRARLAQDDRAVVARFGLALGDMPEPLVRAIAAEVEARLAE